MRVLLIAEESAGAQLLRSLENEPHEIVAVLTTSGPGRPGPVAAQALRQRLPVWPAGRAREPSLADEIRRRHVDITLNVHSLYLVPDAVLGASRLGSFNLHPGPLPEYAGLNAPSWTLFHGEAEHGVTVHRMVSTIDGGAIAFQRRWPIAASDNALSLSMRCVREGVSMLIELLDCAERGEQIPAVSQDLERRKYFGRQVPHNGWIQWEGSALGIWNLVRACDYHPFPSPWGRPRARLQNHEVAITKVRRTGEPSDCPPGTIRQRGDGGSVLVSANDLWLVLERVYVDGEVREPQDILEIGSRFEQ